MCSSLLQMCSSLLQVKPPSPSAPPRLPDSPPSPSVIPLKPCSDLSGSDLSPGCFQLRDRKNSSLSALLSLCLQARAEFPTLVLLVSALVKQQKNLSSIKGFHLSHI